MLDIVHDHHRARAGCELRAYLIHDRLPVLPDPAGLAGAVVVAVDDADAAPFVLRRVRAGALHHRARHRPRGQGLADAARAGDVEDERALARPDVLQQRGAHGLLLAQNSRLSAMPTA